jgi:hypothetical protein
VNNPRSYGPASLRGWALVIWPAFVTACLLEAFAFSLIDPSELHWSGHALQLSRQGVYTLAFFCFWLISMVCSGLTWWLARPGNSIRSQDFP